MLNKMIVSLICFVVCFLPTWLWLAAYHVLSPDGFLQKAVVFGFGVWMLGAMQFVLLFIFVGCLATVWND